jgi:hypothetical protein
MGMAWEGRHVHRRFLWERLKNKDICEGLGGEGRRTLNGPER